MIGRRFRRQPDRHAQASAFVDGQLSANEVDDFTRVLRDDAELQAYIDDLRELKALLAALQQAVEA